MARTQNRQRIDNKTRYAIIKEIEDSIFYKDGFVEYAGNISDKKIAEKYGVGASTVGKLRSDVFGNLKSKVGVPSSQFEKIVERVTLLEARLDGLIDELERSDQAWLKNGHAQDKSHG